MIKRNIFREIAANAPVRKVANHRDMTFIRNFIQGLHGMGCRVVVPENMEGLGATIIIGDGSDVEVPEDIRGSTVSVFIADIVNSAGAWSFTEQDHSAAGTFTNTTNGRTGTADEINGIDAPGTGSYSFTTYVFEFNDDGTKRYSFQFPTPDTSSASARQVLRLDSNKIPEWGCVQAD